MTTDYYLLIMLPGDAVSTCFDVVVVGAATVEPGSPSGVYPMADTVNRSPRVTAIDMGCP